MHKILNNIYIINENNEKEPIKLGSYIYEVVFPYYNPLFEEERQERSSTFDLIFEEIPLIKNNQFNKYIRENKSFFILAKYRAWGKENEVMCNNDNFSSYFDLYLSKNDIIKKELQEERNALRTGEIDIIHTYYFELKKSIFCGRTLDLKLYKSMEESPRNAGSMESLETKRNNIQKTKCHFYNKEKVLSAYDKKIEQGFRWLIFETSEIKYSNTFFASLGVVRTEKNQEILKIERLTKLMNEIIGENKLNKYDVINLVKKLNITRKRNAATKNGQKN